MPLLKYQCCVPMCNSSKKVNNSISFHKFPSANEEIKIGGKMINRRQVWIENLKISNINVRTRVCSLHFKESDFFKAANKKTKSLFLKRIAIPSINNEKSEYPTHPSCIPSMFPKDEINKNVINETQTTEMVDFNNIDLNKVCEDPTRSSYIPSILHVDEINKNARNEIRTTEMVDFKNINYDRVCRGCLSQDDNLKSMNESIEDDVHDNNILLSDMFMDCTSIRIDDNDNLPKQFCDFCVSQINQLYLFKKNCQRIDESLRYNYEQHKKLFNDNDYIINNDDLSSSSLYSSQRNVELYDNDNIDKNVNKDDVAYFIKNELSNIEEVMIKQEDLNIDKSSDEEDKNDNGEVELNTDKCIKMENTEDTLGTRFPPKQNKSKAFCCVYGCGSRAWRNPDVRFHKFPKENVCFVKVTNSLGVEEKIDCRHMWQRVLKIEKNITEHMLVCSLHFRKSDYFLPDLDSKNKRCLKKNSVPSCNLPGDDYKTGYDVKTTEGGYFRTKEVMIKQENCNIDKTNEEDNENENGEVELNTHKRASTSSTIKFDKCITIENTEDTFGTRFPSKQNKSKAFCCVPGCRSKACRNPDVRFHRFPKENVCFVKVRNCFGVEEKIDCRKMWQRVLKIEKNITEYMLVCSLHFSKADYFLPDLNSKRLRRLKKNAVPSCNLPG